jgi:cell division protein FtsQ
MWDNPRLLNATAGFLIGITALACTLAGAHWLLRSSLFPIRVVELRTPLQHASTAELQAVLARYAAGNFFAAPIDEVRAAAERLPWVRRASVRRVWPDRLEVTIEEHVAFARWGTEALVNVQGERFSATSDAELPLFIGPPGTEAEIARRYSRFAQRLAPLGSPLERVVLSARHGWQLRLANGLQITLGRDVDAAEERLAHFVDAYVPGGNFRAEVVDLRYPNGFAVRAAKENKAS